jgi:hypothetical protein
MVESGRHPSRCRALCVTGAGHVAQNQLQNGFPVGALFWMVGSGLLTIRPFTKEPLARRGGYQARIRVLPDHRGLYPRRDRDRDLHDPASAYPPSRPGFLIGLAEVGYLVTLTFASIPIAPTTRTLWPPVSPWSSG